MERKRAVVYLQLPAVDAIMFVSGESIQYFSRHRGHMVRSRPQVVSASGTHAHERHDEEVQQAPEDKSAEVARQGRAKDTARREIKTGHKCQK